MARENLIIKKGKVIFPPALVEPSDYNPDNPRYELCVILSEPQVKEIKALKTENHVKTAETGESYVSLKSRRRPTVIHPDKAPFTDEELSEVGSGSLVNVRVEVFNGKGQFASKRYLGLGSICVLEVVKGQAAGLDDLTEGFEGTTERAVDSKTDNEVLEDDDDVLPF